MTMVRMSMSPHHSRLARAGRSPRRITPSKSNILMIIIAVLVLLWLYQFATVYHAATTIAKTADGHVSLQTPPSRSTASTTVATDTGTTIPIDTQQATKTAKATIGFAVSITGCGSDPITEGAAVLKHSIHRASIHGNSGGQYDYALYAIYHPSAAECALPLQALDFTMLKRETPVAVADIQGDFLRSKIEANGCCGEKELIKLEAYTLTQHEIIVHLDLDVLVLKPMDDLFDVMLANTPDATAAAVAKVQPSLMRPNEPLPVASSATLNAFYTLDYNMVGPKNEHKPVQGGFLVLRPDQAVYEEYKAIVKEGDFRDGSGWGGLVGPFHGSMTFQGIIPYYYNVLHTGQAVEVNRCIYNQMCDNPRTGRTLNDVVSGVCRTNEDECEDCRSRSLEDVVTTHFTLCQKPWWCLAHTQDAIQHRLCRKLHHEWYKIRSELEQSWGRSGRGPGSFDKDQFYGYCKASGKNGYFPIAKPYGGPVDEAQ